jgi:Ca-activated chloride channel family protein
VLNGRRAQAMRERIVQLALAQQLVTRYTSFVVVEERVGERRASEQPETRVVPVNAPAGWGMFGAKAKKEQSKGGADSLRVGGGGKRYRGGGVPQGVPMAPGAAARPAVAAPRSQAPSSTGFAPPPPPAPSPSMDAMELERAAPAPAKDKAMKSGLLGRLFQSAPAAPTKSVGQAREELSGAAFDSLLDDDADAVFEGAPSASAPLEELMAAEPEPSLASDGHGTGDAVGALLGRQLASGLWAGAGEGPEPVRQARGTALALLELLRHGITSSHALHGAQVKKAVDALLSLAASLTGAPEVAELALGVAWLAAAGPRTRGRIEQAAKPLTGLDGRLGNEVALRQHVDALAAR